MKVNSGQWIRARHGGKGGLSLGGFGGSLLGVKRKLAWLAVCVTRQRKILKRWVGAEEDDYLAFSTYNKKKLKKWGIDRKNKRGVIDLFSWGCDKILRNTAVIFSHCLAVYYGSLLVG